MVEGPGIAPAIAGPGPHLFYRQPDARRARGRPTEQPRPGPRYGPLQPLRDGHGPDRGRSGLVLALSPAFAARGDRPGRGRDDDRPRANSARPRDPSPLRRRAG